MATLTRTPSRCSKWFFSGKSFKLPLFLRRRRRSDGHELQILEGEAPTSRSGSSATSSVSNTTRDLHWRGIFQHFDANGDGKVSSEELRTFFASIGDTVSAEEVEGAVGKLLEYSDFVRLMEARAEDEGEEDIRRAFEMFEAEKGSGCITPDGLRAALWRLGGATSREDCMRMIRAYDVDGNGVIDYQEFRRMMACA